MKALQFLGLLGASLSAVAHEKYHIQDMTDVFFWCLIGTGLGFFLEFVKSVRKGNKKTTSTLSSR